MIDIETKARKVEDALSTHCIPYWDVKTVKYEGQVPTACGLMLEDGRDLVAPINATCSGCRAAMDHHTMLTGAKL